MAPAELRHVHPGESFMWPRRMRVGAFALVVTLAALVPVVTPRVAHAEPRLHQHGLGFGYHTLIFRTESSDNYTLHAPSLVYDYFIGRRWGFMLRGAAYFPVYGTMSGPTGDFSGSLLDMYDQRHFGFDLLTMVARRWPLTPELALTVGAGAHLQSVALNGAEYSPVEDVSLGVGGVGKLDYALNEWLSTSAQLAMGVDFIDLVDHANPSQLVLPLSLSFAFEARY